MICIYCDKEVLPGEDKFMLAIEMPYINLITHKLCYKTHKNTLFLQENAEKVYNIARRINNGRRENIR